MSRRVQPPVVQGRVGRKTAHDDAEILPCTLADIMAQDAVCRTSPARIIRTLRKELIRAARSHAEVGHESRQWAAALVAVGELAKGAPVPQANLAAWRRLAEEGLVEVLVDEVLEGQQLHMEPPPGTSKEFLQRVANVMKAPYTLPMEILANSSRFLIIAKSPRYDGPYLSVVKAKWSQMMERMWKEPFNSLREEESHIFERFNVASLFNAVMFADASILDIAYYDFTIPLVTRNWIYSGSCTANQVDALQTSGVLNMLLQDLTPEIQQYTAARADTLSRTQLFAQMCVGAGTTPYSEKRDKVKALVDAFGTRFAILNGREAEAVLQITRALLGQLVDDDKEVPCVDAFAAALVGNETFWSGLFQLMRRVQRGEGRGSDGQPSPKRLLFAGIMVVFRAFCRVEGEATRELLLTCARAGFFDAFDDVVDDLLDARTQDLKKVTATLGRLFATMRDALVLCDAEQRAELGAQFPRWRTLAALFMNDLKTQMQLPEPPHPDTLPISQVTWQMYNSIAIACKPVTICARRGCNSTGTARCSVCKIIRYCGAKCQKTDWKDHKRLCGTTGHVAVVFQGTADTASVDDMIRDHGNIADELYRIRRTKQLRLANVPAFAKSNISAAPRAPYNFTPLVVLGGFVVLCIALYITYRNTLYI